MCPFLIILCVFVHGIILTSACGDHPVKYVISKIYDGEYTLTEIEQNVITSLDHAYSIKLTIPVKKLCKGLLNITHLTRYLYINEGLEDIEPGVFEKQMIIEGFFFGNNRLKTIRKGTFENLLELNEIDLTYNEISVIEPGAFNNLTNLRILHLSKNKLTTLNPDSIINTPRLVTLNMNTNFLGKLKPKMFSFLAKDKAVDLSFSQNFLTDIHYKTFEDFDIIKFNISMNKLRSIPDVIAKNRNLELVDLSWNQLRNLPGEFFELKKLKNVVVHGNPLDCITLSKLRKLGHELNMNILLDSFC
ncbi:hypothetical protein HHI36_016019 [Cryptolaemus montrouzieri]|uniref:Uncharacterized protein n=1 Tax=Cryptolaemus montrouzieri TaxID=559131 RepID=A0ABD2N8L7_9CUCU